mmetsp:Transcript_1572/g.2852  ORF Transcript_1572/g.2852 Transcript_1572/m.2852 type:complete len:100 (+) Transcript_1572:1501-1800(+)
MYIIYAGKPSLILYYALNAAQSHEVLSQVSKYMKGSLISFYCLLDRIDSRFGRYLIQVHMKFLIASNGLAMLECGGEKEKEERSSVSSCNTYLSRSIVF